jgi:hypothetical protein
MNFSQNILNALKPRGPRESFRMMLTKGITVAQVHERLDPPMVHEDGPPIVARRAAYEEIAVALREMVAGGSVNKNRVHVKNAARAGIDAMIDVYRLK